MATTTLDKKKLAASGLPAHLQSLIIQLAALAARPPSKGEPGRGIREIVIDAATGALTIALSDGTKMVVGALRGQSLYDWWAARNPGLTEADFLTAMRAQASAELLAARDQVVEAAEGLGSAADTLASIRDGSALAETGTVLIGFRNGRAALTQREDGLFFLPSAALRTLLLGTLPAGVANALSGLDGLVSGAQTEEGITLIGFRNGRAAILQRSDGLDFVPSAGLRARITAALREAVETSAGIPLVEFRNGRVAIMQRSDGLDFVPSQAFLDRLPIQTPDPLSATLIQMKRSERPVPQHRRPMGQRDDAGHGDGICQSQLLAADRHRPHRRRGDHQQHGAGAIWL